MPENNEKPKNDNATHAKSHQSPTNAEQLKKYMRDKGTKLVLEGYVYRSGSINDPFWYGIKQKLGTIGIFITSMLLISLAVCYIYTKYPIITG